MKEFDVIAVGTGSVMAVVEAMIEGNPKINVAVIDKDEPGGICLTRGCIPSKILLYPAEIVQTIRRARDFGLDVELRSVDFVKVMDRMHALIHTDIDQIQKGLSSSENIDYFHAPAEFTAPYTMRVDGTDIHASKILLGAGSEPIIPAIPGLKEAGYLTSDTILGIRTLPRRVAVIGGGYIAAEYGFFLASMGAEVTVLGRNPQFLAEEEPEISHVAKKHLGEVMRIETNHEVLEVSRTRDGKRLRARNRETKKETQIMADEVLVAAGRGPVQVLHPERAGIKTDPDGWIVTDEYLATSQPNVWALGDATGKFPFKHKANYDAQILYYNLIAGEKRRVDYHAVPHAVFTDPEVASVGLKESEAVQRYGAANVLIGFYRYEDTAKGEAMDVKDYFVKILVERRGHAILGAHIVGPEASVLIQEIINLMYTNNRSVDPVREGMHIHPALSEVVERACLSLMPPEHYHHRMEHALGFRSG
jgi:dihydrolipoamide dehydrogenase